MNLLDLLFPIRCVGCRKWGRYFCKDCVLQIAPIEHQICPVCMLPAMDGMTHPRCSNRYSLDGMICFFHYKGVIRSGIKAIKYRFISDLAKEFVDLIPLTSLQSSIIIHQSPILIPIPLHPSRLAFRGFNQTEVLGELLAQKLNIHFRTDVLIRTKKTIPQVEMKDKKKRLKNMEDVFSINQNSVIINHTSGFILFDDVCTTGATLRAAGNTLKRAGASFVWGVVLAHG